MVGYGGKDLQKRKVLSLEWKSEGVMDDESGESMEPMEEGKEEVPWHAMTCGHSNPVALSLAHSDDVPLNGPI